MVVCSIQMRGTVEQDETRVGFKGTKWDGKIFWGACGAVSMAILQCIVNAKCTGTILNTLSCFVVLSC